VSARYLGVLWCCSDGMCSNDRLEQQQYGWSNTRWKLGLEELMSLWVSMALYLFTSEGSSRRTFGVNLAC
jgi:hypothetical protein